MAVDQKTASRLHDVKMKKKTVFFHLRSLIHCYTMTKRDTKTRISSAQYLVFVSRFSSPHPIMPRTTLSCTGSTPASLCSYQLHSETCQSFFFKVKCCLIPVQSVFCTLCQQFYRTPQRSVEVAIAVIFCQHKADQHTQEEVPCLLFICEFQSTSFYIAVVGCFFSTYQPGGTSYQPNDGSTTPLLLNVTL